jgi:hypothetical protein
LTLGLFSAAATSPSFAPGALQLHSALALRRFSRLGSSLRVHDDSTSVDTLNRSIRFGHAFAASDFAQQRSTEDVHSAMKLKKQRSNIDTDSFRSSSVHDQASRAYLSRAELRAELDMVHRANVAQDRTIAALSDRLASLERRYAEEGSASKV